MKRTLLTRKHPKFYEEAQRRRRDLFEGGEGFRSRVSTYLPKNAVEPEMLYTARCREAHYLNYIAPLTNLFASWVFCDEPDIAPAKDEDGTAPEVDPFYAEFSEDCDGVGTDGDAFLRARLVDALVDSCSYWQVCFPEIGDAPLDTLSDWQRAGAGRATLRHIPAHCVINWRRAKREQDGQPGRLLWLLEYQRDEELIEITDADITITETWTLWRDDGEHQRWQLQYAKGNAPAPDVDVPEIAGPYDPTGILPIVDMCLPHEMRLVELLSSAQLEHFRLSVALSVGLKRACYVMPVIKSRDAKNPPAMGSGYYLSLGTDESMEWTGPPSAPFDTLSARLAALKDEIHRIAIAMAQGVDNNAAAIGRSGESKDADASATVKILAALGKLVVLAWERTYDLVSLGRGDALRWSASGMDDYEGVGSLEEILTTITAVDSMEIPSPTLKRTLRTRAAMIALGEADDATKALVRQEIETAAERAPAPPPPPTLPSSTPTDSTPPADEQAAQTDEQSSGQADTQSKDAPTARPMPPRSLPKT